MKRHLGLVIAVFAVVVTCAVIAKLSMHDVHGTSMYGYPLDDTYIHMAIAKNLALHGTWGISAGEFGGASSSLLWTLQLAATYRIVGTGGVLAPLVLNLFWGVALLVLAHALLLRRALSTTKTTLLLLLVAFCGPMPTLICSGMEHVMHTFFFLAALALAVELVTEDAPAKHAQWLALIVFPLAVATRYESTFLIAVICVLLLLRRRFLYATVVGAVAVLPIVVYGAYSIHHGSKFLPNSVLLKGLFAPDAMRLGPFEWLRFTANKFYRGPSAMCVLFLWIASAALYVRSNARFWSRDALALLLFFFSAGQHLLLASTGWFYRYEAYLVMGGLVFVVPLALDRAPSRTDASSPADGRGIAGRIMTGWVLAVAAIPFLLNRVVVSATEVPGASRNIFEQQFQMARFLERYYAGRGVVANDVGAISYFPDVRVLDVFGLGSIEVTRAKLAGKFDRADVEAIVAAKAPDLAIVYEGWLEETLGGLPAHWVKVGDWTIRQNVVCAGETVSFYALRDNAAELRANLASFRTELPTSVIQHGSYLDE